MRYLRIRLLFLAALSALLLAIALPNEVIPYGTPAVGFIALVPYFLAVVYCPSRRFAVRLGFVYGALTSLLTNFWLAYFHGFSVWTVSGVGLGMGLYFMLFTPFFTHFARHRPWCRPFIFALAWTVYEFIKSIGFLGFPWGLIAYPVGGILPLVQIADVTGVWGVSFVMALISALGAELIIVLTGDVWSLRPQIVTLARSWLFAALCVAGMLGYGFVKMGHPLPAAHTMRMVLVQENVDSWLATPEAERGMLTLGENLTRQGLARAQGPVDLVVWSESALLRPYRSYRSFYEHEPQSDPFIRFLSEIHTPVLLGAPYVLDFANEEVMNASLLLNAKGDVMDYYGKRHLVPFAEYIPFWNVPAVRWFMENIIGIDGGWTPGDSTTVFTLRLHDGSTVAFGTPICFEDSFADIARGFFRSGADLLINLTNTSWSKTISAETQQFASARFMAVENNRVLVRSTNSGVTSVIDPYGRVLASLPLFTPAALTVDVPVEKSASLAPYTLYGDWVPKLCAIVLVLILAAQAGWLSAIGGRLKPRQPEAAETPDAREPESVSSAR